MATSGGRGSREHHQDGQLRQHSHVRCLREWPPKVCKWLHRVGAAADISRAVDDGKNNGVTLAPGLRGGTCRSASGLYSMEHSIESLLLLLLLQPLARRTRTRALLPSDVEQATVRRDTRRTDHRPALLAWAQDVTATPTPFSPC